jgi:sugar phosphate isomerase/epimerase
VIEQFSVAESAMPALTFEQDLDVLVGAEVGGIGIDERKLGAGPDAHWLELLRLCGLRATLAVPALRSILPTAGPGRDSGGADLAGRLEALCSSVRRLAAFDPVAIGVQAGQASGRHPDECRALLVHGLRMLARTATKLHPRPFQIALEPVAPEWAASGWEVTSLPEAAELIDATGEPNLGIVLDTWHLAEAGAAQIAKFSDRILLVQLAERAGAVPEQPGQCDAARRVMGTGRSDCAATVQAMFEAGYRGWYELEACAGPDYGSLRRSLTQARGSFRVFYRGLAGP